MMSDHPITPPLRLVREWRNSWHPAHGEFAIYIATQAARWGADQELKACCEEMKSIPSPLGIPFGEMASNALRSARRPKPPSLKDQALANTNALLNDPNRALLTEVRETLELNRRALEQLPDDPA